MKRKIKRKVFMMGMAVTATMPISASAKAGGKPDFESHPYSSWRGTQLTVPGNNIDDANSGNVSLIGKLKSLFGVGYSTDGATPYSQGKGWQVELLQNDAGAGLSNDARQAKDKRFGLAFRLSF
jgi:hypothetical protein